MHQLHRKRIEMLRAAYDQGLSIRSAAASCGVAKGTAERYWRRWASQDFGGELSCPVSGATKRAFKAEADRREVSVQAMMAFMLETIAEDNLFDAVLEDFDARDVEFTRESVSQEDGGPDAG